MSLSKIVNVNNQNSVVLPTILKIFSKQRNDIYSINMQNKIKKTLLFEIH